jgi:predicted ester cyclase
MGIPPTGRSFDIPMFGILRFEDGRAVERWGYSDTMAMMLQLGLTG